MLPNNVCVKRPFWNKIDTNNIQDMELEQLFVYNLKKWRKERGISQKELAERCKAAHSYIRQIESRKGHPSFVFIEKLAHASNIEPYQLFYDETTAASKKSYRPENLESIRSNFIKNVSTEFDKVLEKLNTI